jgi:hypothetical protein
MTYTKEQWRFNDNSRYWKTHPFSVTCRKTGVSSATIANIPARATISLEEQKANARLIAAAPELYQALWAMVTSFHAVSHMEDHMKESSLKARAALAKADGRPL